MSPVLRTTRTNTLILCSALLGTGLYAAPAVAQQAYTTLECRAGTVNALSRTDDMMIFAIEHRGVQQSNHESKLFHNWSQRCVGTVATIAGKRSGEGWCRNIEPASGDAVIIRWLSDEQKAGAGTFRIVNGTGKWKGVTGGGTYEPSGAFRPVDDGTYQSCISVKGTALVPSR
jgi:hypothetical protein